MSKITSTVSFLQHFLSSFSTEMMNAYLLNSFTGRKKDLNYLAECEIKNFAKVAYKLSGENELIMFYPHPEMLCYSHNHTGINGHAS